MCISLACDGLLVNCWFRQKPESDHSYAQGRCLLMASMTSMAQNQLLEVVRGSPWHAAVLHMLGAQVERGVFLDSLLLLVRCRRSLLLTSLPDAGPAKVCMMGIKNAWAFLIL